MIAGRGAVNARKRRQRNEMKKQRKAKLEAESKVVSAWFAEFDTDKTGVLSKEQLSALLKHLAKVEPSEEALSTAMANAVSLDTTGDGVPDTTGISRKSATDVVSKYQAYVKEQKGLDEIFAKYDTSGSGDLQPGELKGLLKAISPLEEVTEEDEAYVLEICDKSNTGTILRSEVLAACATWKQLLEEGKAPHMSKGSSACVLL